MKIESVTSSPPSVPVADDPNAPATYVAYYVKLVNNSSSDVNWIRISGTTLAGSLDVSFEAKNFNILSSEGTFDSLSSGKFSCQTSTTAGQPVINCDAGLTSSLAKNGGTVTLALVAKLPNTRTTADKVDFKASALYREGSINGSLSSDGIAEFPKTTQVTADPLKAEALVPVELGARFYTGDKGVPKDLDDFTTTVDVPSTTGTGTVSATIDESSLCPDVNPNCKGVSKIIVPLPKLSPTIGKRDDPLTKYLVFKLRLLGTKFTGNVAIYYSKDGTLTSWSSNGIIACAGGQDPMPADEDRCVYNVKTLKRGDTEVKENPELLGVVQATILAKENGFYSW